MMNPKLLLGIDELTLVLSIDIATIEEIDEWAQKAELIIKEFVKLSNLELIFGEQIPLEGKCPQGYSVGYEYGFNTFYNAIAYHPLHPKMGVIVKFSAYAWSVYCSNGMNIKKFFNCIKSSFYSYRLSRLDLTADYQNWDMSVNDIYRNLLDGSFELRDSNDKKNHSKITAYEVDGLVNTFYVGSKKTGTRLFMRVYDKKVEQLETYGFCYREASKTLSWIRFEVVFKGTYAHQLTKMIIESEEEKLKDLIANKVAEKYRFYDVQNEEYANFSVALIEASKVDFVQLRLESPRNNDLVSSVNHLVNGSGLFSTMYKCDEVWGEGASWTLLQNLHTLYMNRYVPNDDLKLWIKKNKKMIEHEKMEDVFKIFKESKENENNKKIVKEPPTASIDNLDNVDD